jgi:hypothetical protein
MFKAWKFILFFVICLLLALVVNMPLAHLLPHLVIPPNVQIQALQGNLIAGNVGLVSVNRYPLSDLNYRLKPACFLSLEICYQIDNQQGKVNLSYQLMAGTASIKQSDINLPATEIKRFNPQLLVSPVGKLHLNIKQLVIKDNKLGDIEGSLIWQDSGFAEVKTNLGDYQLNVSGDGQNIQFVLSSLDALLTLNGGGLLKADGTYDININIASDTPIDSDIKNILELTTQKTAHNKYRFKQVGKLPAELLNKLF